MSDFEFSIELVDKISGPADTAAAHLARLKSGAKEAGKSLDYGDRARRAVEELARIKIDPKGFLAAREATKKLHEEQQRLIRNQERVNKLFGWITPYGFGRLGSNILGNLGSDAIEGIGHGLVEGARAAVDLIKEGIAKAFEVGGREEHLQGSFKYLFGGAGQAKAVLEEAERFSKMLPFGGQKTAGFLGELGKAGIKGQAAASSLALSADVAGMSPTGEGAEEAIYALSRLKRHGEFSPRLAEGLNINLTDFYAAIGHKLNVSAADAQKQLGDPGKIGFNTILNTLMEIHSRAIGAPTGSVALEQSKELMQRWAKIKELPEEYLRSIASSPGWSRLSETLGRVLEELDPQKHPEIVGNLVDSFNELAQQAERALTPENVKKFSDAIANLPDTLKSIAGYLDTMLTISETIATVWAASKMVSIIEAVAKIAPAAGTITGAATGAVSSGVAGAVAGAAGIPLAGLGLVGLHDKLLDTPLSAANNPLIAQRDADVASGKLQETQGVWSTFKSLFSATPGYERSGTPGGGKGQVMISVPKIEVNITPAKDDINHTGQQVGAEVHRAATQALARAADESGAS